MINTQVRREEKRGQGFEYFVELGLLRHWVIKEVEIQSVNLLVAMKKKLDISK